MTMLLESYWSPVASRKLLPNERYLFPVLAPPMHDGSKVTDVYIEKALTAKGWEIVSTGAPPPEMGGAVADVAKLLQAVEKTPEPPVALRVIAVWKGLGPSTLPTTDGFLYYGPLAIWYVPYGPALPAPEPKADNTVQWVVGGIIGLGIIGLAIYMSRPKPIEYAYAHEGRR